MQIYYQAASYALHRYEGEAIETGEKEGRPWRAAKRVKLEGEVKRTAIGVGKNGTSRRLRWASLPASSQES